MYQPSYGDRKAALVRFIQARVRETHAMHREADLEPKMLLVLNDIEQRKLKEIENATIDELEKMFKEVA